MPGQCAPGRTSPAIAADARGRPFDHTAAVLREAAKLDVTGLVFALDPPVIIKTGPTTPLVGLNWRERRLVVEVQWLQVLDVPGSSRVRRKAILVYDDVFTSLAVIQAPRATRSRCAGLIDRHLAGDDRLEGVQLAYLLHAMQPKGSLMTGSHVRPPPPLPPPPSWRRPPSSPTRWAI